MSDNSAWTRTLAGRPSLGSSAERSRTTTMRDVEMFTDMTGDRNPIHYDVELATSSPFGGLIVQGGVTTGLLKAVRVGETITGSVKIEHVRDDKPICKLETVVRNASGEVCITGTATTYTMPLSRQVTGQAKDAA